MAQDNVEVVRRAYEAWNSEGLDALRPWIADTIELQDPPEVPDSGTWQGSEAVFGRLAEVAATIGGRWVELQQVRAVGDEVLAAMDWRMDRASDSADLGQVFHLVRLTSGKIDRMRVFLSEAQALAAAGR
jgi:ketosteroid isomerase-like protein